MSIKQALPVFSNYKEILTQGRNKENKNGGEDYAQISLLIETAPNSYDLFTTWYNRPICEETLSMENYQDNELNILI